MDLAKVLQQLRQDLANIDTAIASLERLENIGRNRGRPPGPSSPAAEGEERNTGSAVEPDEVTKKRRGRKPKTPPTGSSSEPGAQV